MTDTAPTTDTPPTPDAPKPEEVKVTLTQAQLDAQSAGIRKEAERTAKKQAEKALADSLGVSVDEAKQIIADQKAAQEAAKDATQKAVDAAKAREDAAKAREDTATLKERKADAKIALVDAGVNPKRIAGATTLLFAALEPDADEAAITAAVETLKTDYPEFFGAAPGGAPSGDPSGPPKPGGNSQPTGLEAGRQRALARKASSNQSADDPLGAFAKV